MEKTCVSMNTLLSKYAFVLKTFSSLFFFVRFSPEQGKRLSSRGSPLGFQLNVLLAKLLDHRFQLLVSICEFAHTGVRQIQLQCRKLVEAAAHRNARLRLALSSLRKGAFRIIIVAML